jgi:hypothetical protein
MRSRDLWWTVDWPQGVDIQALICESSRVEQDACIAIEALSNHPTQGYIGELVSCFIFFCTTANISVTAPTSSVSMKDNFNVAK